MKSKIHPKYHPNSKVTCACGNAFTTGSTLPEIHLEICSACHPFFTGEMKLIDTQGRIEKFQAKQQKAAKYAKRTKKKKKDHARKVRPSSLKEMLTKDPEKEEVPNKKA